MHLDLILVILVFLSSHVCWSWSIEQKKKTALRAEGPLKEWNFSCFASGVLAAAVKAVRLLLT